MMVTGIKHAHEWADGLRVCLARFDDPHFPDGLRAVMGLVWASVRPDGSVFATQRVMLCDDSDAVWRDGLWPEYQALLDAGEYAQLHEVQP